MGLQFLFLFLTNCMHFAVFQIAMQLPTSNTFVNKMFLGWLENRQNPCLTNITKNLLHPENSNATKKHVDVTFFVDLKIDKINVLGRRAMTCHICSFFPSVFQVASTEGLVRADTCHKLLVFFAQGGWERSNIPRTDCLLHKRTFLSFPSQKDFPFVPSSQKDGWFLCPYAPLRCVTNATSMMDRLTHLTPRPPQIFR